MRTCNMRSRGGGVEQHCPGRTHSPSQSLVIVHLDVGRGVGARGGDGCWRDELVTVVGGAALVRLGTAAAPAVGVAVALGVVRADARHRRAALAGRQRRAHVAAGRRRRGARVRRVRAGLLAALEAVAAGARVDGAREGLVRLRLRARVRVVRALTGHLVSEQLTLGSTLTRIHSSLARRKKAKKHRASSG